jgi:hypothetical protein
VSGPFTEDPRFSPRNTEEPGDDEQEGPRNLEPRWRAEMSPSGSHWTELNWGHFDQSRGPVEDAE